MVIKKVNLDIVVGVTSTLPETPFPEVAFAGKSNVGKSSLINALMNRKSYARTSSQPGKTQTINFYNINDSMYLVDLPGYGYANVSPAVKAKWGKMIEKYLRKSSQLKQVFLLIDIRHDPSDNDRMMYDWIVNNGYRPVIVATKLDKIKRSQISKQVKAVRTGLGLRQEDILIPFSSQNFFIAFAFIIEFSSKVFPSSTISSVKPMSLSDKNSTSVIPVASKNSFTWLTFPLLVVPYIIFIILASLRKVFYHIHI